MRKFKRQRSILFILFIIFIAGFILLPHFFVFAAKTTSPDPLKELESTGKIAYGSAPQTDVATVIGNVIKIVLEVLGLILFVLLISGGVMWMTSGGDEEQIKKAKNLLSNAIIGLAIIILAYATAHFVTERFSKVPTSTSSSGEGSGSGKQ